MSNKFNFNRNKNFIGVTKNNKPIEFKLENVHFPFGVEKYNNKEILNIEFSNDNNEHYNIFSELNSLEHEISTEIEKCNNIKLVKDIENKGLMTSVKKSIMGYIIRTHFGYIDPYYTNEKLNRNINISKSELVKSYGNATIILNGVWHTGNNYGLLWKTTDLQITKFGK